MHGVTLRGKNRVLGLVETFCLSHTLPLEKVAEGDEKVRVVLDLFAQSMHNGKKKSKEQACGSCQGC